MRLNSPKTLHFLLIYVSPSDIYTEQLLICPAISLGFLIEEMNVTISRLPIYDMEKRHPGLTVGTATSYLEAATVSLNAEHEPPQDFLLNHDEKEHTTEVMWNPPSNGCLRGWANRDDATRDGAYACAIAAAELSSGLFAMRRAETLTGADYYVAPKDTNPDDLESCIRLEVSGTRCDEREVRRRLSNKIQQVKSGRSSLPAIAVIVGFKTKQIMMRTVDNDLD
ncbi:hypothetical protein BMS3Abin15_00019 [bacterium BMS3Abin15]|nr:hypothetical protein BMS3Abin15_00019 [bacterium BMS3Abin15]